MPEIKSVPFLNTADSIPVVRFCLADGTEGICIIDTGSELTVFDSQFVLDYVDNFRIRKTKSKINIVGMQLNNEAALVYTNTAVCFEKTWNKTNALPIKHALILNLNNLSGHIKDTEGNEVSVSAIIGSDVLSKHKTKIDFSEKKLWFYNDIAGDR